jgi:hypothetical protein
MRRTSAGVIDITATPGAGRAARMHRRHELTSVVSQWLHHGRGGRTVARKSRCAWSRTPDHCRRAFAPDWRASAHLISAEAQHPSLRTALIRHILVPRPAGGFAVQIGGRADVSFGGRGSSRLNVGADQVYANRSSSGACAKAHLSQNIMRQHTRCGEGLLPTERAGTQAKRLDQVV